MHKICIPAGEIASAAHTLNKSLDVRSQFICSYNTELATVQTSHNLNGTRGQNAKNACHTRVNAKIKFCLRLHVLWLNGAGSLSLGAS